MRKIVAGLFISLDGVTEAPENWQLAYINDEMLEAVGSAMPESDTMLLGRRTYEEFAGYWPDQGSEVEFADHMNNTPKLVVSTTLDTVEWRNASLLAGNVAEELTSLKQQPGKDISITGSATLVRSLLREGVLDELRLLVHPIVVGRGGRLFRTASRRRPWSSWIRRRSAPASSISPTARSNSMRHDALVRRAGRREWVALLVLMLPGFVVAMDLTVLHLTVPVGNGGRSARRAVVGRGRDRARHPGRCAGGVP